MDRTLHMELRPAPPPPLSSTFGKQKRPHADFHRRYPISPPSFPEAEEDEHTPGLAEEETEVERASCPTVVVQQARVCPAAVQQRGTERYILWLRRSERDGGKKRASETFDYKPT